MKVNLEQIDPDRMPEDPEEYYKDKGWVSWEDFLGVENAEADDDNEDPSNHPATQ